MESQSNRMIVLFKVAYICSKSLLFGYREELDSRSLPSFECAKQPLDQVPVLKGQRDEKVGSYLDSWGKLLIHTPGKYIPLWSMNR